MCLYATSQLTRLVGNPPAAHSTPTEENYTSALDGFYLTQCIDQVVLEIQLPHKTGKFSF